jgi:hypothetical protein
MPLQNLINSCNKGRLANSNNNRVLRKRKQRQIIVIFIINDSNTTTVFTTEMSIAESVVPYSMPKHLVK